MNHSRKLIKRSAAIVSAAILGTAALPMSAFAADSYSAIAKEAVAEAAQSVSDLWSESLAQTNSAQVATWTISLGDAGKAMAGMTGFDLSWLQNMKLVQSQKLADGVLSATFEILVNDGTLVHANYLMDLNAMKIYFQIPEISDAYIMANLEEAIEMSEDGISADLGVDTSDVDSMGADVLNSLLSDPTQYFPTGEELANLISAYGTMFFDNVTDADAATETITANGISQEVTVYNGSMNGEQALATIQAFVDYAETDETLANVLSKLQPIADEDLNAALAEGIAELRSDMEGVTGEDAELFVTSNIYQDADGNTVGETLSVAENETSEPEFTFKMVTANDGSNVGLELYFEADGDAAFFAGTGDSQDELNGEYTLTVNGTPVVKMQADHANGNSGTLVFSIPEEATADDSTASMLSAFNLVVAYSDIASKEHNSFSLSVTSGGSELATVALDINVTDASSVEAPSIDTLGTVYDADNESDMQNYASNLNLQALFDNATAAGVPEEFLNQILATLTGDTGVTE